jgi:hypothetical protein
VSVLNSATSILPCEEKRHGSCFHFSSFFSIHQTSSWEVFSAEQHQESPSSLALWSVLLTPLVLCLCFPHSHIFKSLSPSDSGQHCFIGLKLIFKKSQGQPLTLQKRSALITTLSLPRWCFESTRHPAPSTLTAACRGSHIVLIWSTEKVSGHPSVHWWEAESFHGVCPGNLHHTWNYERAPGAAMSSLLHFYHTYSWLDRGNMVQAGPIRFSSSGSWTRTEPPHSLWLLRTLAHKFGGMYSVLWTGEQRKLVCRDQSGTNAPWNLPWKAFEKF